MVGVLSIVGNLTRNSGTCNRESKSAAIFATPGICCAWKWMLCDNDKIINLRMSCISLVSLEVVLLITWTTAELSEWITTVELARQDPQSSNAITMGKNSRTEIWHDSHSCENSSENHFVPKIPPKPKLLASVNKCRDEVEWTMCDGEKAFPLKFSKKTCQAFESAFCLQIEVAVMMRLFKTYCQVNEPP